MSVNLPEDTAQYLHEHNLPAGWRYHGIAVCGCIGCQERLPPNFKYSGGFLWHPEDKAACVWCQENRGYT